MLRNRPPFPRPCIGSVLGKGVTHISACASLILFPSLTGSCHGIITRREGSVRCHAAQENSLVPSQSSPTSTGIPAIASKLARTTATGTRRRAIGDSERQRIKHTTSKAQATQSHQTPPLARSCSQRPAASKTTSAGCNSSPPARAPTGIRSEHKASISNSPLSRRGQIFVDVRSSGQKTRRYPPLAPRPGSLVAERQAQNVMHATPGQQHDDASQGARGTRDVCGSAAKNTPSYPVDNTTAGDGQVAVNGHSKRTATRDGCSCHAPLSPRRPQRRRRRHRSIDAPTWSIATAAAF